MPSEDAELVRAARGGGRDAYGALVHRYVLRIRAVCRARLGQRGPVDDLVQESFLRALRGLASLTEPEKFGSWLHGIAVHTCLDWLKARDRTGVSLEEIDPGRRDASVAEERQQLAPEENERRDRLLAALEGLPEIYRETIVLFYYEKQSYEQIGQLLGVGSAAVNARLTKARAMLREKLAPVFEP